MIPQGFGDPIGCFAHTNNETWRDNPHLPRVMRRCRLAGLRRRVVVRLRLGAISFRH